MTTLPQTDAPAAEPSEAQEPAPSHAIAKLIPLEKGLYAFTMVGQAGWTGTGPGLAVPAVHISSLPQSLDELEITDVYGHPAAWLGARHSTIFLKSPRDSGLALVTTYAARDPARPATKLEIRRLDDAGLALPVARRETSSRTGDATWPAPIPPLVVLPLADPIAAPPSAAEIRVEIVTHIHGRGDIRFVDEPWAGRAGPGFSIESFTVLLRHRLAAAAVEYKGLTAAGVETDWIGSGSPCGILGGDTPLIGFAVRQKAIAGDALFDCEYSGYFHSGAIVGPCRNGAPCLSTAANDPLEGIQLRIIERPKRPNLPRRERPPD
jgi:hypothetical protein